MAQNRVIGRGGKVPWKCRSEMQWFKSQTMGHTVIMGRKTFESVGLLPGRNNIVLTRGVIPGVQTLQHLSLKAFDRTTSSERNIYIIGGAEIYRQLLPSCDEIFLSVMNFDAEGDTLMPEIPPGFEVETVTPWEEFTTYHYQRA